MTTPHPRSRRVNTPVNLRVIAWRGRDDVVLLGPAPGTTPSVQQLHNAIEGLRDAGVREVFTPALGPTEQINFLSVGFVHHEHLHLLSHDLKVLPETPAKTSGRRLRRGRWRDYGAVLDVDGRAFDAFWHFDASALTEARRATPTNRFRVSVETGGHGRSLSGYAITGRSRTTCYLQRLAVDPRHQRQGIGSTLVCDALGWARSRRVRKVLVNTQERNGNALQLYLGLGFVQEPTGLDVLRWPA